MSRCKRRRHGKGASLAPLRCVATALEKTQPRRPYILAAALKRPRAHSSATSSRTHYCQGLPTMLALSSPGGGCRGRRWKTLTWPSNTPATLTEGSGEKPDSAELPMSPPHGLMCPPVKWAHCGFCRQWSPLPRPAQLRPWIKCSQARRVLARTPTHTPTRGKPNASQSLSAALTMGSTVPVSKGHKQPLGPDVTGARARTKSGFGPQRPRATGPSPGKARPQPGVCEATPTHSPRWG